MAQDPVNIGTVANDGTGDTLRAAFAKLNANDAELYALVADVSADTPAELLAKLLTVDGPGSGLNADLLDGLSSADFAAASHAHVIADVTGLQAALDAKLASSAFTGAAVLALLLTVDGAGSGLDADTLDGMSSAAFATAVHSHSIAEVTGLQAALDAKLPSASYTAADVLAKLITVDGVGSGLDADTLDGQSSAAFAAASHAHAISDVTGLQAALDGKGDLSSSASVSVDSELAIYSGTTGKLVKRATGSGLATLISGVLSLTDPATFAAAAHTHAEADVTGLTAALAAKLDSSSYTAADVLAKLITVDGAGSGLDADLLDGMSSADFAAASHTHAQSDITGLAAALAAKLDSSSYTAADVLSKLLTVDGAGSGLDADTLDGTSSAGFALASHSHAIADITGLPGALVSKLDSSAYTAADVLSKLLTVDGASSGLDADLLDGAQGSAYALRASTQTISGTWDFTASTIYFRVTPANAALVTNLIDSGGTSLIATQEIRTHRVGAVPFWVSCRLNGSYASPTPLLNGDDMGEFSFGGWNGSTIKLQTVRITASAAEDWSGTVNGATLAISTVTAGGTSLAARAVFGGNSTGGYARFPSGVASQPGIAFASDNDNGLYLSATNEVSIATAGAQRMQLNATAVQVTVPMRTSDGTLGAPGWSFASDSDTGIYSSAANEATLVTGNVRRTVWDSGGRVLFGGLTTSVQIGSLSGLTMQIGSGSNTGFSIARFSNDANAPAFVMGKSRDGTVGGATAVQSGDNIARWQFAGADGTDVQTLAAGVYVTVQGTVSTDVVPGQMEFYTASSTGVFTEVLRLTSGGTALHRDGTAALPSISMLNDPDCGLYRIGTNQLGISCNATLVLDISTATFAVTATTVRLNTTTASTVGAAGGASALPATPLGYIAANVSGTAVKIPYYNN